MAIFLTVLKRSKPVKFKGNQPHDVQRVWLCQHVGNFSSSFSMARYTKTIFAKNNYPCVSHETYVRKKSMTLPS